VVSEDWGLTSSLGLQVLLLHYLVLVYNLAFDDDRYSKSSVATSLAGINTRKVLADAMNLVDLRTAHAIIRPGCMDMAMGQASEKKQFKKIELISVDLVPTFFMLRMASLQTHKLSLCTRAVLKGDLESDKRLNASNFMFANDIDGTSSQMFLGA
jgi:hypothetical protein